MILHEKDQSLFVSPRKATVVSSRPSRKFLEKVHLGILTEYPFRARHSTNTYGDAKRNNTWS